MLRASIGELRREASGQELWEALQEDAFDQLALLDKDALDEQEGAELQALAGRVFRPARLAQLIRGGIAQSVAEAIGNPQAWLLVCRSLKHIPAWVLEEEPERAARVAADIEWRKTRGRRPGARSAGETPAATGQSLFGEDADGRRDARRHQDGTGWQDPALRLEPLDAAMLEALVPARKRRSNGMDLIEATSKVWSAWVDIARNTGPWRDLAVHHPQTGQRISRAQAREQAIHIELHGIGGCSIRPELHAFCKRAA